MRDERENDQKHIRYTARMVRYWPGKLTVDEQFLTARALPGPCK